MQSWAILSHSIKMVVNNFGVALRMSTPLIGAMVLSLILFGQEVFGGSTYYSMEIDPLYDPVNEVNVGLATLIQAIAALWVAVAWHRYILLEEKPDGLLPALHGGRVLAYFGWGLLLMVVIVVIILVATVIGGVLNSLGGFGALLGVVLIAVAALVVFYFAARVYVILPSAAIGRTLSFSQAWEVTRGYGGSIIFAYILFMLIAIVSSLIVGVISAFSGLIGTLLMMALNLILILIGMSFLTTIYGVTVENRDL